MGQDHGIDAAGPGAERLPVAPPELRCPLEQPQSSSTRARSPSTRNLLPVTVPAPPRNVSIGRDRAVRGHLYPRRRAGLRYGGAGIRLCAGRYRPGTASIALDLASLSFCDARGLRALVRMNRYAERLGRALRLMSLRPQLQKIIRITGLDREFHVEQRDPADNGGRAY